MSWWLGGNHPPRNMDNAVVVIVGASQGLGAALAERIYHRYDRMRIVLASRNVERLRRVKMSCVDKSSKNVHHKKDPEIGGDVDQSSSMLKGLGEEDDRILVMPTDICVEGDCRNLVVETIKRFGRIDYLILNSGVNSDVPVYESNAKVFHTVMDTNVVGLASVIQFALYYLAESKGMIIALSSLAGLFPVPGGSHYSASKHALEGYLESIRPELRVYDIDLSVVDPGSMKPDDGAKRQVVMWNGAVEEASESGTYRGGSRNPSRKSCTVVADRIIRESIEKRKERIHSQWQIVLFVLMCAQFWFPGFFERRATRNRFPHGITARTLLPLREINNSENQVQQRWWSLGPSARRIDVGWFT